MEKKYTRARIGETYVTNEGYEATIVDGGSQRGYVTIRIGEWEHEVLHTHVKRGSVKYPLHRSVHGVGYVGIGPHKTRINGERTMAYRRWHAILTRCYYEPSQAQLHMYHDVTVNERWHDFQQFADWFYGNYKDGF